MSNLMTRAEYYNLKLPALRRKLKTNTASLRLRAAKLADLIDGADAMYDEAYSELLDAIDKFEQTASNVCDYLSEAIE